MDAATEPTAVDAKDELIECLHKQVAHQKELIVQQANALTAANREAAQNKAFFHSLNLVVENLFAERAKLVNDIVSGRERERQLEEKLRLCAALSTAPDKHSVP